MERKCASVVIGLLVGGVVTAFLAMPSQVLAAGDDNAARIERLEAALKAMQAELAELKAAKAAPAANGAGVVDQKSIDAMVEKAISEQKGMAGSVPQWVQDVKLFGDFRYRHEEINDTGSSESSNAGPFVQRERDRIRARLGLKAKINEEFDTVFRLATGSSDTPTSGNQTLGDSASDSFSHKEIWLDWAYFDWHPESTKGLNVYGGKMKQPFYTVGDNELVWDGDVSPEGIVAKYSVDLDKANTATITGGGFWLAERSGDADASFWGLQGLLRHDFEDGTHLLGGATWYDLGNVKDKTLSGVNLAGNTDDGSGGYKYDYNLVEGFAEYGFSMLDMPATVFGIYIENTAAPGKGNNAFSVGWRLNEAVSSKPGSWQLGYGYLEVDPDAVFAGLTASDSVLVGGTGAKGHVLSLKYQVKKDVQAGLNYYLTERFDRPGQEGGHINFIQTDLIFKF
jgi:hypothetical protein